MPRLKTRERGCIKFSAPGSGRLIFKPVQQFGVHIDVNKYVATNIGIIDLIDGTQIKSDVGDAQNWTSTGLGLLVCVSQTSDCIWVFVRYTMA